MKSIISTARLYMKAVGLILHDLVFHYMARSGLILGANTLTNLIPTMYRALDVVSREQIGFIPAVLRDSSAEQVALNETVNIPIVPIPTAADITPGVTAPDTGDQAIGNTTMTITKSRMVPVRWSGEEQKGVKNSGMFPSVNEQRFQQALRVLCNEVEADLAALCSSSSRAYGTAGTAPFGTAGDLSDSAQMLKILEDNGAPMADLHAVFGSGAIANLRGKQSVLFKVNEAGTDQLLRQGIIGQLQGAMVHNSAQVKTPTVGTGASYTTNTAGYAVGATAITLITGTGTILAGDIVTFAGDTNKYVVGTALTGGVLTLAEPGLRKAIGTSATAVTVVGAAERSMYFPRSAIALLTRAPAMPDGGDAADDVIELTDPITGLAFQVAMYRQYRQVHIEVGLAWGVKGITPRHIGTLLG
jgi:hypothetical protein